MTVYKIYENLDDLGIPKSSQYEYGHEMVAFTNKKKIFKEYMRVRRKKRFIVEKQDMDEDDFVKFANRNRLQLIEYQELTTIDKDDWSHHEVKVPMTSYQYSNLIEIQDRFTINEMGAVMSPKVFRKKYKDALCALEYDKIDAIANHPIYLDDLGLPEFIFDQVKLYAHMCNDEFE